LNTTEPVLLYVLWHRAGRGQKWRKVARCSTRAEALNLARGSGDYWIAEVRSADLANTLFPDDAADQTDGQSPV
jgi:hypothetical protein